MTNEPVDVLDELLNDQLEHLARGPLEQLGMPWFHTVLELLLKMHPENAVAARARVVEALSVHAREHGCCAVTHFEALLEHALAAWRTR